MQVPLCIKGKIIILNNGETPGTISPSDPNKVSEANPMNPIQNPRHLMQVKSLEIAGSLTSV